MRQTPSASGKLGDRLPYGQVRTLNEGCVDPASKTNGFETRAIRFGFTVKQSLLDLDDAVATAMLEYLAMEEVG